MTVEDIRRRFLEFFVAHGHTQLPAGPLIPEGDPSVLFTTAGMQQFKSYYLQPEQAPAENIVTIQPCLRTSDIDEVGDETHLTYFEMLGNFSFGGYGKEQAIALGLEFLGELGLPKRSLKTTYFGGEGALVADETSHELLKQHFPPSAISAGSKAENFWGPTGDRGPCGPTVEFHARGTEIWDLVFNEYYFEKVNYTRLKQLGVDTGAGLERLAMVLQKKKSVFETDELAALMAKTPDGEIRSRRIVTDHCRAISALVEAGLVPSNKDRGYVLRRLIRRAATQLKLLKASDDLLLELTPPNAHEVLKDELARFAKVFTTAERNYSHILKNVRVSVKAEIPAAEVFRLQESYGLPVELTEELARRDGLMIDHQAVEALMREHQEKSRAGVTAKFTGGLVEVTVTTTRLHTAHHLLLAALRQVLGPHVVQRGSNITDERLRLDYSHPRGATDEELQRVEDIVNEKIQEDLPVTSEEMELDAAYKAGALGEFGAKYPQRVTVYSIGARPSSAKATEGHRAFSMEICGGPHVEATGRVGKFKIIKEEASGAGIRRIRAVVG